MKKMDVVNRILAFHPAFPPDYHGCDAWKAGDPGYVRDAAQLGYKKGVIQVGHFNWEELGMKYAREWISALLDEKLPVIYLPSGDMYCYELAKN